MKCHLVGGHSTPRLSKILTNRRELVDQVFNCLHKRWVGPVELVAQAFLHIEALSTNCPTASRLNVAFLPLRLQGRPRALQGCPRTKCELSGGYGGIQLT